MFLNMYEKKTWKEPSWNTKHSNHTSTATQRPYTWVHWIPYGGFHATELIGTNVFSSKVGENKN